MELKRLRYFIAVAEELHFGRAAERLQMAQPPLSRQIAQLEKELGVLLIDRSRAQIRLTQAGHLMLMHARDLTQRLDNATREVALVGKGGAGQLRVAFVGSATHGILPAVIRAFRIAFPQVDLVLSAMNNAELKHALIQREIDIAIARPSLDDDEFRSELFHHENLILALPDTPAATARRTIRLADLSDQTFVLYPDQPRPSFADHVIAVCSAAGFTPAQTVFARDYQTAISLVSVGVGVALVPESVSQTQRAGVAYRQYEGFNPGTSLSLNARIDSLSPHVRNFFEVARRQTQGRKASSPKAIP